MLRVCRFRRSGHARALTIEPKMKEGKRPTTIASSNRIVLAILFLLLGSFYIAINISGYTFIPAGDLSNFFPIAIIVFLTIKGMTSKDESKTATVSSVVLHPIAFSFIISKIIALNTIGLATCIYAFITFACSMILFFRCKLGKIVRIVLGTLYSILLTTVLFLLFITATLKDHEDDFVTRTMVNSKMSPNSMYLAEVIDADAGATGGNTLVQVTRRDSDINLLFATLKKDSKIIYKGRWGESLTLRWETDDILYVNERKYVIGRDER